MTTSGTFTTGLRAVALLALAAVGTWLVAFDPTTTVTFLAYALVGTYLVLRRPRNLVGSLLIASGWVLVATTSDPTSADIVQLQAGTADLAVEIRAWTGPALGGLGFVCYAALAFIFPSGDLPPGRRGRAIAGYLGVAALVAITPGMLAGTIPVSVDGGPEIAVPNPFAVMAITDLAVAGVGQLLATVVPLAVLAAAVIDTVRRYRRSSGHLRLQFRWLMAALAFVCLSLVFGIAMNILAGRQAGLLAWLPALVAFPTVPLAVGVAVMRYRLFEIDRIVSRSIGWLVLTAILGAIFAGGIVSLSSVLSPWTAGSTIAVAGSTLVAAVLFQPLRQRVQHAVDRRFDRARIDGDRITQAFADRMRDEIDLGSLQHELTGTVDRAIRPIGSAVWLRSGAVPPMRQP
jgi:hypothetical protein